MDAYDLKRFRLASYPETCAMNPEGRRKFRCPSCGAREFTPYIDTETGQAIDANECGICNHFDNCGYHVPPREYFRKYPEKRPGGKMTKEEYRAQQEKRRAELQAQQQYLDRMRLLSDLSDTDLTDTAETDEVEFGTLDWRNVEKQKDLAYNTPLYWYLLNFFDEDRIREVFEMYHMGGTRSGHVIYWQIDNSNRVRTGKLMKYGADGHRAKLPNGDPEPGAQNWYHSLMQKKGKLPDNWKLQQCLFGAHLLKAEDLPTPVCLVEAEKTAIIAACAMPQFIWVATGGLMQLKSQMLQPLIEYCKTAGAVTVFADLGARDKWETKLKEQQMWLPYKFSNFLESRATAKAQEKKMDLADYLLGEF